MAVLAFAVEDMKALDMVMTSANPFAFLSECVKMPQNDLRPVAIDTNFWSR